ncbi:hypothetical protein VKT23_015311 [Stygiomarasmius scandens]|uniref:Uncharacterized protein n=1 Tax=Marasmiellus scandens TaxID=2682957 RepID=A0ABR1IY94_9AGAR
MPPSRHCRSKQNRNSPLPRRRPVRRDRNDQAFAMDVDEDRERAQVLPMDVDAVENLPIRRDWVLVRLHVLEVLRDMFAQLVEDFLRHLV